MEKPALNVRLGRVWLFTLALAAAGSEARAQTLAIFTENAPPTTSFVDAHGNITGSATELVRLTLDRAGVQGQISVRPWPRALLKAETEANSCVFAAVRTPEREPRFKWVTPLAKDEWYLFGRPDSPAIASLADARGYRIGGYYGDAATNFLKSLGFLVEEVADNTLNPRKLLARHLDFWVVGILTGGSTAQAAPEGAIIPILKIKDTELGMACNRGVADETIDRLNRALQSLIEDGTAEQIRRKFTDRQVTPGAPVPNSRQIDNFYY